MSNPAEHQSEQFEDKASLLLQQITNGFSD